MAIILDHTIVPAHGKEASAQWFAHIFGLTYDGLVGHFAPVHVNETLTLDFDDRDTFESHHYAFHISDEEFDAIMRRVLEGGFPTAAGPAPWRTARSTTARAGAASTSTTPTATSWR